MQKQIYDNDHASAVVFVYYFALNHNVPSLVSRFEIVTPICQQPEREAEDMKRLVALQQQWSVRIWELSWKVWNLAIPLLLVEKKHVLHIPGYLLDNMFVSAPNTEAHPCPKCTPFHSHKYPVYIAIILCCAKFNLTEVLGSDGHLTIILLFLFFSFLRIKNKIKQKIKLNKILN